MKLLLIEDEPSLMLGMLRILQREGHHVSAAERGESGIGLFRQSGYDLVITDLMLPDINGMEVLRAVKDLAPDTGVIVITAYANVKTAVETMRAGAYDYLSKPFDPEELLILIERFAVHRRLELDNSLLREELHSDSQVRQIIGNSAAMHEVMETIKRVARSDASVIITGETGTGKELVANAVHGASLRKTKPFIKINCAAIPEPLLESELFGHEKGAFTGALRRKQGKFEIAHGGTILFDEIGDMPAALQAKLLRVLESLTFERLGGNEQISVDVRMLYATRRNLEEEVRAGNFREDLYYRINVVPIMLPPLRERKPDIPDLVREFLCHFCTKSGKPGMTIDPRAMDLLTAYHFPGNVRELKHAMEMAVTLSKGNTIMPEDLPVAIRGNSREAAVLGDSGGNCILEQHVKAAERACIARALDETGGRKTEAAIKLGISRKTLWRKLREHDFPSSLLNSED